MEPLFGCDEKIDRSVRPVCLLGLLLMTLCLNVPPSAAQFTSTSSIDGTVTDETGATLPGVIVVLRSPALQVPQLEAVTDGSGRYRFPQLPAGSYSLRFEIEGFQAVVRDGLDVGVGFAARLDMPMKIGSLNESITVTGASPVVDVSTTTASQTITTDQVNSVLPTSRMVSDVLRLAQGVRSTAPPAFGMLGVTTAGGFASYGLTTARYLQDGVDIRTAGYPDMSAAEEVDVKSFGNGAEAVAPGLVMNIVTKSGGNNFHGRYGEQYMSGNLQSNNLTPELRAQGLTAGDASKYFSDFNSDLGGRIIHDKLWFYGNYRQRQNKRTAAGFVAGPGPDGAYGSGDEPPFFPKQVSRNVTAKLSYQVSKNYQLVANYAQDNHRITGELGGILNGVARYIPRESSQDETFNPTNWGGQLRATPRSNLLLNLQGGRVWYLVDYFAPDEYRENVIRFNRETQQWTGAASQQFTRPRIRWQTQGNLTYLPESLFGSHGHELKVGYRVWRESQGVNYQNYASGNYILVYDRVSGQSSRPAEIQTFNYPINQVNRHNTYGGYLNDRWQLARRLTVNLGLRYDLDTSFVPEQTKQQGPFGDAGTYARFNANKWKGWAPRTGLALDLTGNGKTVVKGTYGWYNDEMVDSASNQFNRNSAAMVTYRWRDQDGNNDYTPGEVNLDLNGLDFISTTSATNNLFNPDLRAPRTHEISAQFDRELRANMAARAVWVWRRVVGSVATVNVLRPFDAFNVPLTRRDPGPNGTLNNNDDAGPVTVWDYDAAYRGASFVGNEQQNVPNPDTLQTFELQMQKRLTGRWGAFVSYSATRADSWLLTCGAANNTSCALPQSPNDLYFPKNQTTEHDFKLNGSYVMPFDIRFAGTLEWQPGLFGQRVYVFRAVDPDGGAPLVQQSTVRLRLEPFGSQQASMRTSANFRVSKLVNLSKGRLQFDFDLFNVLNASSVWAAGYESGPTYGYVSRILSPRVAQFGVSYEF